MLKKAVDRLSELSATDLEKLVHELSVHQIELEMHNEELRRAQAELGASRAKYADLYDFAPQGYFTLDRQGLVREVNLTGAKMLAVARNQLLETPLLAFVVPSDRPAFLDHLAAVFAAATKQTSEIELRSGNGATLHVRLESLAADVVDGSADFCRTSMSDVTERHHTEEVLRESEQKYRLLFENMAEGFALYELLYDDTGAPADWRVLEINAAYVLHTGLSRERILGRRVGELFPGVIAEYLPRFAEVVASQRSIEFETFSKPANRYLHVATFPAGPNRFASTITDITERKRAEAARLDNELRASALINSADESILLFDFEDKILAANNTAARRLGQSVEALVGKNWQNLLTPALAATRKLKVEEVGQTGSPIYFEDERAGMIFDHRVYPVRNSAGKVVAVALFSRDITARRQAEEAWRQSREDMARAQQVGQIGSWRLDVRRNVLTWSDENHRIFGIPKGTPLTYEAFLAVVHPDDRTYVDTRWQAGLRGEPYDIEHRLLVDGQVVWVREKAYLEFGTDGSLLGGFGITQDITARKQAEEEIGLLNEQLGGKVAELEAANRELEGFTYSVSHDLRAPIRHIAGFAQLLETKVGPELNAEGRKFLEFIINAADKLGILVDELLEFSRMGRTEIGIAEVDLEPLIKPVVEIFRNKTADRQIEWRVGELPVVHGDSTMLRFVVENLIGNAVKFTSTRAQARIEIGAAEDESNYRIFVKDNGVGFDMAYYDKLFGVFQRLHSKKAFEGTGIGLANVQRIIHRHGGKVWAEGKIDEGATFTFSLPKETKGTI